MSIQKNTPNLLKKLGLPFSIIINQTMNLIKDPAALGIYMYLISKPEDWDIQETDLMRRFNKGRDFIRGRLKELKDVGLLKTTSTRNDKGHIIGWTTMLYSHLPIEASTEDNPNPTSQTKIKNEKKIKETPQPNNQITENPESGENQILDKPPYTNNRLSLVKKETTTTKQEVVVVSETIDQDLIELRNECMPNDEREPEEFVKQCKWHLDSGDKNNYTFSQRLAGLKRLIRNKTFETPATYPKPKKQAQNFVTSSDYSLLQDYKAWLNDHSKRVSIETWFPDAAHRARAIKLYFNEQDYLKQANG